VGAVARRIRSDRGQLWFYLKMWGNTLRVHRVRTWPLSLGIGAGIWLGSYGVFVMERLIDIVNHKAMPGAD
jgi:hypothetical protein